MAFEGKIWSEFGSPADVLSRPVFNANVRHWLAPSEDCDDLVWAWLRHQGKREPWQKLCKCCASQVNKRNRRIVNKRTDISIKPIPFCAQMTLKQTFYFGHNQCTPHTIPSLPGLCFHFHFTLFCFYDFVYDNLLCTTSFQLGWTN